MKISKCIVDETQIKVVKDYFWLWIAIKPKDKHHLHSLYEKNIIERRIQYIKDRTECFDDYFPCRKEKCRLEHIINWFNLFVDYHNKDVMAFWE